MKGREQGIVIVNNFNQLTDEIVLFLLSFCDTKSLIAILLVCRNLHRIGSDDVLWKPKLQSQFFNWPIKDNEHHKTFIDSSQKTYQRLPGKIKRIYADLIDGDFFTAVSNNLGIVVSIT